MIIELGFQAEDYQEINKIKNILAKPEEYKEKLTEKLKIKILERFLEKCESIITGNSEDKGRIFIDRGKEREGKPINILWEANKSRINGIVGALAGELTVEELKDAEPKHILEELNKCGIEATDVFKINLQIKSRFDMFNRVYFLSSLLTYSDGFIRTNEYTVYESMEDIFDFLLVDLLRNKLLEAIPKGYYRTYCRIEANDERVRGSVDISRHIRLNMGQNNGRIAYSYRENSVNNPLNRLILAAYDYLKIKYPELIENKIDNELKLTNFLAEVRSNITYNVQFNELIKDNLRPISHPYFQEYEMVRVICLQILRDEGVSLFDADKDSVNGFLYYLPDLWEEFLEPIFKDAIAESRWSYVNVDSQNKEAYYLGEKGVVRPDFTFGKSEGKDVFLVLDAKMRPAWGDWFKNGKNHKDIKEDADKCIRDMVVYGASGTGVVFPMNDDKVLQVEYRRQISDYNTRDYFYVLPFFIPSYEENTSVVEWEKTFQEAIQDFKEIFCEKILIYFL